MEELFTKDVSLPPELRELPYDVNSVMHFDLREFSKNGHRTITIKDLDTTQERDGLSNIDLKKINKVYREECDARDRTEKIEMCQRYPGVARRKRELTDKPFDILDHMSIKTLAPKPEQKPQPVKPKIEAIKNVEQLRMDQDIMDIKELAYKVVTMVLTGIRRKQCDDDTTDMSDPSRDVLGIEEAIVNHANFMIDLAQQSGQAFCDSVNTVDAFVNFVRSHPQFGNIRSKRQTNRMDGIQKPAKVNNDRVLSNDSVKSAPIDNVKTINLKASTITKDILHQATEDTATSNVSEKVSVPTKIGDFISGLQSNGTAGEANIKKLLRDGDDEDSNTEDEGIDHHGKVRAVPKLTKENEDFYSQRKWPDGVVRYVIKDNPKYNTQDLRKRINEVNAILKTRTCIYFEEITSKAAEERWLDYIVLDSETDDYITGRTGGTQIFGCKELFEGNHHNQLTAMMMMTILGFYFEVCRPDRDQYVRVHTRHIRAVRHLRQKYSIAVAIAVIKTKPPNQTIEQYLGVLKNKIKPKDKMDEDEFNISLCSEDFAMDDETSDELTQTNAALTKTQQSRAESPTLLGDFNFDVAINQQRLEKADSLEEALEVLKEIDKGHNPLAPQPSTSQQPDYFHQVPENCTEISIPNCYRTNINQIQHSIDTHMNTNTFNNFEKHVEIGKDVNEPIVSADKHTNQQINSSFGDMDIERNCLEVDNTQSTFVDIQRCFLDTQETYMETQETELNTQELLLNSQVAHDDMNNTEQYDFSQQLTHVSQSQIEDSRFKLLEMYIIGGNKTVKPPPNRNKIIPKAVEISQFMAKNDSDKNSAQDIRGDPKNGYADSNTRDPNVLSKRLDNTEEPKCNSVNKIVKNNKLLDITNTVNTANDITMTAEEEVTGNSKITENSCKTMPKRAKIDDDTTVTQDITSINSEEKSQSITQTENVIPFKIIEELNRVKTLMSRRNERRLSTDGYSTDSGFVSDSQIKSSLKTSLHCSDSGLNQSAHCLFNYLMTCQYNANNLEIASEISDVLSELVDSLHTDEVYPPFLDEVLDKIKTLLDDVSENKSENVDSIENPDNITQKDETIHRLLLLNKSINIITYTIDQITIILEKFHTNVTSTENLYEITNLEQTENLCYIFHILDSLLQRYDKKNHLFSSQSSSQNSQDKIFKRNSITDIWKKKWNPDFRKKDVVDSPFRNRGLNSKISDVLNKIVVDCMDGYSLVSYAALQCFNLLQS